MAGEITLDELLAAFKEAGFTGKDDPGMTLRELCAAWKCAEGKAKRQLQRAKEAGLLRVGKRASQRVDGMNCHVPVYSFAFPKKSKVKR